MKKYYIKNISILRVLDSEFSLLIFLGHFHEEGTCASAQYHNIRTYQSEAMHAIINCKAARATFKLIQNITY